MSRSLVAVTLAGALLSVAGCHRKPTDPLAEANATLSSAGFKVDPPQPYEARKLSATQCQKTRVENLDAILCMYGSPEAQQKAESDAEAWIASALTGATARRGLVTLVIADRDRVDPNGKTIHKIVTAFKKQ